MGLGEPDFTPPPHVLDAVKYTLDEGKTQNTEILITVGGRQAISLAMQALINSGDEALTPDLGFVYYEPSLYVADGVPVSTPLVEGNGFNLDKKAVISHITKKSCMIIVNSPNNPTGSSFLA